MYQLLSVWGGGGGVHPLKWVWQPLKCAINLQKSLLSVLGVGPV